MKIETIHIHNFRGIINQTLRLGNYSLLVGANNSGKTTVIDCIRAFYEKDKFSYNQERDFPKKGNEDTESFIEIVFTLTDEEYDSLAENYKVGNNKLTVIKSFESAERLSDGKSVKGVIRGLTKAGVYSSESFYGAQNVQNGKFGDIIYIPASNEVTDFIKLSGPSALRDLISKILANVIEESVSYADLISSILNFSSQIKASESKHKQSLNDFEQDLNKMLSPWGTSFQLRIETPPIADIIKSMTKYIFLDNDLGCEQNIENYGSGFQRHFIYSLINSGHKYLSTTNSSEKKEFSPKISILLFEEPEAFLHPPQQMKLAKELRALANQEDWQVICSTHSPVFVSKAVEDLPSIIHLEKINTTINVHQVNKDTWDKICESNNVILDDFFEAEESTTKQYVEQASDEMNWIRYFLCLNPDRASAFFSDLVVLVEGISEVALLNKLIDDLGIRTENSVYVFDCLGKHNTHRFMNLFGAMGIYHSVLFDLDGNKNEKHKKINNLIMGSKNSFTTKIKPLTIDLEAFLGVEKPKDNREKPQHLLYYYLTQKLDQKKLDEFTQIVSDLLAFDK